MVKRLKIKVPVNARLVLSGVLVLVVLLTALFGRFFTNHDAYAVDMNNAFIHPCRAYLFGTDNLGRCVLCRIIEGAALSIFISIAVTAVSLFIGLIVGAAAGFIGGFADRALMKLTLIFQVFPSFVLAIAIGAMLGSGILNTILALVAVYFTTYARLARSMVMSYKNDNYIKAARLYGAGNLSLLFKYIMPGTFGSMAVTAALDTGNVILSISSLSFIGLGAPRPTAEWGAVMNEASAYFQSAPWIIIFNGLALFFVVTVFNLFGDSLRDRMDSKREIK